MAVSVVAVPEGTVKTDAVKEVMAGAAIVVAGLPAPLPQPTASAQKNTATSEPSELRILEFNTTSFPKLLLWTLTCSRRIQWTYANVPQMFDE